MPSPTPRNRRAAAIVRGIGFALAMVLGGVGIWLIVKSGNSTQRIEVGVLIGLWGLLLGAICGRRMVVGEPATANPPVEQPASPPIRADLAVPVVSGLDRTEATAARRAFAAELHAMLRRELANAVENAVGREMARLRGEIAVLRSDLLERVNRQLRLQRIETTTVIGSDLDTMRAEVGPSTEPPPQPFVELTASPSVRLAPTSSTSDPFAALPKLTPFTAFPLDPVETPAQTVEASAAAVEYAGRRRAGEPPMQEPTRPVRSADTNGARPAGRRRRADNPEGQELLTQLLAREGRY